MIYLNHDKCILCKQCIYVCHDYCISLKNKKIEINNKLCDQCTQCVAICPKQAISIDHCTTSPIDWKLLPDSIELEELFKARRSIRFFSSKKIERNTLEKIIEIGRYAPTMDKMLELVLIDNKDIMESLKTSIQLYWDKMYKMFFRSKLLLKIIRFFYPGIYIIKSKMENRKDSLFNAPVAVIIIGKSKQKLSELSAQYYAYNIMLYSFSLGIGSIVSDASKIAINAKRKLKESLNIPTNYRVLSVILLGYPTIQYKNKVEGLRPIIR